MDNGRIEFATITIYFGMITLLILMASCDEPSKTRELKPIQTIVHEGKTAGYNDTRNAYFGDVHVHTSWSFDAFIYNVRTSPDDAYKYGKGREIDHVSGTPIQMQRPLDFMAVADHSEYMGVMLQMADEQNPLSKLAIAGKINSQDPKTSRRAFGEIGEGIATNTPKKNLIKKEDLQSTWQKMVAAADRHYEPGKFTTFPAYEWTSSPGVVDADFPYARNLHRNVIFKGGKVAPVPFSSFDSQKPEELWNWMEELRIQDIDVIAIPHNANISDGKMYALESSNGQVIDKEYAQKRMLNEPINEVVQIKGQSMSHPALSPNDEFSDFELYQSTLGRSEPRVQSKVEGSYVRDAFKNGLSIEQKVGANPFQFGVIGSTDCHNGASNIEEDNNIGKSGVQDHTPEKRMSNGKAASRHRQSSVAGVAAVWAKENTREAIFEAFESKEVFATSGPRIKLRLFGGWDLESVDLDQENWLSSAYEKGKPMGSTIGVAAGERSPSFIIWAVKDSDGANLDRIQVVKGWVDAEGKTFEKIFDVAWSDDRQKNAAGKLPALESSVDLATATYTNDIGSVNLHTTWTDPEFDAAKSAFYYLRVLEIPTPRWTTYDAVALGVDLPSEVPPTIQERAWSSPVWYNPKF